MIWSMTADIPSRCVVELVRWVLRLVDPTLGSEVAFVISLSAFHFNRIDRSTESIAVSTELIFVPRSPSELIRPPRKLRRLLSDTSSTSEFVDALNGNREKRIPDRRIQRRYESLLADRPAECRAVL
jgi:hypothetical protein